MQTTDKTAARGFTLVEVLVAMLIFLVTSMGLLPLLLGNLQANQDNALYRRAQRLAAETMVQLQLADAATLSTASNETQAYGLIAVQPLIERDTPTVGQARLTVAASWQQRGHRHLYQLQSVRTLP